MHPKPIIYCTCNRDFILAEFALAALENTVCDDKLGFFLDFVTSILFQGPLI